MKLTLSKINGYKTFVGGVLHAAWAIYYLFIDQAIESEMQWRVHGIIGILTGTGLAHKVYKNKEAINNTFKNKKK